MCINKSLLEVTNELIIVISLHCHCCANDKITTLIKTYDYEKVIQLYCFTRICTADFLCSVFCNVKAYLNLSSYIGENSDHPNLSRSTYRSGMEYQFNDMISYSLHCFFKRGKLFKWDLTEIYIDADADVKN